MNADELFEQFVTAKEYVSPGYGKKQCPNCNIYIGCRTKRCKCGHKFSTNDRKLTQKEQDVLENKPTDEDIMYSAMIGSYGGTFVHTMTGSGPDKPKLINKDFIYDYCEEAACIGHEKNKIVSVRAIKNWLAHSLEYNSKEYSNACVFVDQWYSYKMGK